MPAIETRTHAHRQLALAYAGGAAVKNPASSYDAGCEGSCSRADLAAAVAGLVAAAGRQQERCCSAEQGEVWSLGGLRTATV